MNDRLRPPSPGLADQYRVVSGDTRCILGEGPLWLPECRDLLWVDILEPAVFRLHLATGEIQRWSIPENIGWVIPRRNETGFIAGLRSGFAELTLDPFQIKPFAPLSAHEADARLRLNDAKADAAGRIFAGTMDMDGRKSGKLLRLDSDRSFRVVDDGYGVTNGPTFSPRGETLYHTDSKARRVFQFDVGSDGTMSNKRLFVEFIADWGEPDGMTTDSDGGVWIAHWGGSRVSRFSPEGVLQRSIHLPAAQITSCTFGGPGLDRLFVTSAALGRPDEPLAGCVFEVDPGCTGFPPNRFTG